MLFLSIKRGVGGFIFCPFFGSFEPFYLYLKGLYNFIYIALFEKRQKAAKKLGGRRNSKPPLRPFSLKRGK